MTDKGIDIPQLARKWAVDCQGEGKLPAYGIAAQAAAEYILATTEPTMADIDWNEVKHTLAGATFATNNGPEEVVMLASYDDFISYATLNGIYGDTYPKLLTPNGKKYELREVGAPEEPEHPATLVTEQDYENAPVGTVVGDYLKAVVGDTEVMWQKLEDGRWWRVGIDYYAHMPGERRPVIRWGGWGK